MIFVLHCSVMTAQLKQAQKQAQKQLLHASTLHAFISMAANMLQMSKPPMPLHTFVQAATCACTHVACVCMFVCLPCDVDRFLVYRGTQLCARCLVSNCYIVFLGA